jgi:tight adherence protein C
MTTQLIVYLVVAFVAVVAAGVAGVELLRRRQVVARVDDDLMPSGSAAVLRPENDRESLWDQALERVQSSRPDDEALNSKLIQAGFDGTGMAAAYFVIRLASMVLLPLTAVLFVPRDQFALYVLGVVTAVVLGLLLPVALLDRTIRLRQERIRRSVPDALDLLVVCVEAGVSLDAAVLRVARELLLVHPDLAHELSVVNRMTNAGVPREQALRGLWQRTGVEDIRALVSSLIQSEKWGTSVATVLRVAAETLRRKRRQLAEKKAKQAPLKMTFPLLFFILPALFAVIMGPAVATIIKEFGRV